MNKFLGLFSLLATLTAFAQPANNPWENHQLIDKNKERPHAAFMLYNNASDAVKDVYHASPFYKSLNGNSQSTAINTAMSRYPVVNETDVDKKYAFHYLANLGINGRGKVENQQIVIL